MDTASEAASSFSLQEYAGILRRRRAIILQAFVIVLVAGVLVTIFQAPTYQTGGKLLVEPQSFVISSMSTSDPLADLFRVNSQYSLPTQLQLLQGGDMRKKVADKIGNNVPGFTVAAQEGTSIILVSAEGDNPDNLAQAINTLMDIYVNQVMDQSGQDLQRAIDFEKEQMDKAQRDLDDAQRRIESFKRSHNVPDLGPARDAAMKTAVDLTTSYNGLLIDHQLLQARIVQTEQRLRAEPVLSSELAKLQVDSATKELLDPGIRALDDQIDQLKIQQILQTEAQDLGPRDSAVLLLTKQLELLANRRKKLVDDMIRRNTVVNPARRELENSLLQMTSEDAIKAKQLGLVHDQLIQAQSRLAEFPRYEFSYTAMQQKMEQSRTRFNNAASKIDDLHIRMTTRRRPARILENAEVPNTPIRPKRAQNIMFAAMLGLFAGLCLALLQELFDDRINSPEDAERALAIPNLGYIPMIEEEGLRLIRDISTFSPLMESYRTLRTNINFAAVGHDVKSILVTSSVPAEGKSTTCANLAMAMALDGKRVIIVDADLRRPAQHKLFKVSSSPGLTDILVGTHTIDDVLQPSKVEGVSIIPAGSPPPNPAELLGSAAMGQFLGNVESIADVVLFDSPPTLAVADAVVLAARVDGVLLVIGFGDTKKTNTRQAKAVLARASARVLGTVLNRMVGPSSGYYYGKYYVPTIDTTPISGSGPRNGVSGNGASVGVPQESEGSRVGLLADSASSGNGGSSEDAPEDRDRGI